MFHQFLFVHSICMITFLFFSTDIFKLSDIKHTLLVFPVKTQCSIPMIYFGSRILRRKEINEVARNCCLPSSKPFLFLFDRFLEEPLVYLRLYTQFAAGIILQILGMPDPGNYFLQKVPVLTDCALKISIAAWDVSALLLISLEDQVRPYVLKVLLYWQVISPSSLLFPGLLMMNWIWWVKARVCIEKIRSSLIKISNIENKGGKKREIHDV